VLKCLSTRVEQTTSWTSGSAARSSGDPYARVSGGRLKTLIDLFAAVTSEFKSAVIWNRALPTGERKYGRWAREAQSVVALADKPMIAIRIGTMVANDSAETELRRKDAIGESLCQSDELRHFSRCWTLSLNRQTAILNDVICLEIRMLPSQGVQKVNHQIEHHRRRNPP